MRAKGYLYVFLMILIVLNMKGMKLHSPHFISELIVALGCLGVLTYRLSDLEEKQNYSKIGRIVFVGVLSGYVFFELENYFFQ
ncbi:hypothetical protein [Rummeliibacillus sp. TYF-LIM-RU47]|uniref:hypothetical protein n=1 Tax=Rummeliibacillus sp. TYF-LIM-RU47 TaxID=2608406 RepID=UPI0012389F01|nr:hypothetical protein [Rummeliibacillus sp. TYF-LIM-RU47]